jgi:predicted nucleic acid binding AN1-type Zn finger protein
MHLFFQLSLLICSLSYDPDLPVLLTPKMSNQILKIINIGFNLQAATENYVDAILWILTVRLTNCIPTCHFSGCCLQGQRQVSYCNKVKYLEVLWIVFFGNSFHSLYGKRNLVSYIQHDLP